MLYPPDVSGWTCREAWLSAAAMLERAPNLSSAEPLAQVQHHSELGRKTNGVSSAEYGVCASGPGW